MAGDCSIEVRFFPTPEELAGCFATFYRAHVAVAEGGRVRDFLQPEWGNVRFFLGDSPSARVLGGSHTARARFTASGPTSLPTEFELGTTRLWGIALFPLGWAKFVQMPAGDLTNRVVDGELHPAFASFAPLVHELYRGPPDDEREYQTLLRHFRARNRVHPDQDRIIAVHTALVDPDVRSVGDFAARAGLNARTLERLCLRDFGFPPKLLLRRQRVMRSLDAYMQGKDKAWSGVLDDHYHDQAHFVRDFRSFMTMSPSQFASMDRPILRDFLEERARVYGTQAQTLDRPIAKPR